MIPAANKNTNASLTNIVSCGLANDLALLGLVAVYILSHFYGGFFDPNNFKDHKRKLLGFYAHI